MVVVIPRERVYWCIGVTEGVDRRNRDVLAMTLLLRRIDNTMATPVEEWDELAAAGAQIVDSIAHESDAAASEQLLLSQALHEARTWLRGRGYDRSATEQQVRTTRRVRVRTAIRDA
jgi:hypothetical protein